MNGTVDQSDRKYLIPSIGLPTHHFVTLLTSEKCADTDRCIRRSAPTKAAGRESQTDIHMDADCELEHSMMSWSARGEQVGSLPPLIGRVLPCNYLSEGI